MIGKRDVVLWIIIATTLLHTKSQQQLAATKHSKPLSRKLIGKSEVKESMPRSPFVVRIPHYVLYFCACIQINLFLIYFDFEKVVEFSLSC